MLLLFLEISLVLGLKFAAPAWSAVQLFDRFLASHNVTPFWLKSLIAFAGIALCSKIRRLGRAIIDKRKAAALGAELPPYIDGWLPGNMDIIHAILSNVRDYSFIVWLLPIQFACRLERKFFAHLYSNESRPLMASFVHASLEVIPIIS